MMQFNKEYRRLRGLGGPAQRAIESARISVEFERLECLGLVRLEIRADESHTLEDLEGDCFDIALNCDAPGGARAIKAQQKAFHSKIEQDGVWGIVGEFRIPNGLTQKTICPYPGDALVFVGLPGGACIDYNNLAWEEADSCWGFVGDDWKDSGYDDDIKSATIQALRGELMARCDCCRQPIHTH